MVAAVLGVGFLLLVGAALGTPGGGVLPDPGPPERTKTFTASVSAP